VEEGVVVGGGVALIRALQQMTDFQLEGDEQVGYNILKKALEEPARWIALNAGKDGSIVLEEIKKHDGNFGYDAKTNQYGDLVKAGIIDPTKVTRSALQNAASIASLILTTEAVVADLPEKKEHNHGMPGMGGMSGMGGMGEDMM
jgi:chaperonin GroEL